MAIIKNKNISRSILILFFISLLIMTSMTGCDNFTETTSPTSENTSIDASDASEESNIIL